MVSDDEEPKCVCDNEKDFILTIIVIFGCFVVWKRVRLLHSDEACAQEAQFGCFSG